MRLEVALRSWLRLCGSAAPTSLGRAPKKARCPATTIRLPLTGLWLLPWRRPAPSWHQLAKGAQRFYELSGDSPFGHAETAGCVDVGRSNDDRPSRRSRGAPNKQGTPRGGREGCFEFRFPVRVRVRVRRPAAVERCERLMLPVRTVRSEQWWRSGGSNGKPFRSRAL
jgi:hypothetical protein